MTHKRRPGAPERAPHPFTAEHGVTEREWHALIALADHGHQRPAAQSLGISTQTFKNLLTTARHRLQAGTIIDAYIRLGWLIVPEDGEPEGASPDALIVRGHHLVHVASCPCIAGRSA
jgi:predicted DNA-binding protein (UPF0251 family)